LLGPEGKRPQKKKSEANQLLRPVSESDDSTSRFGSMPSSESTSEYSEANEIRGSEPLDGGSPMPPYGFLPCTFLEWIDPSIVGLRIVTDASGLSSIIGSDANQARFKRGGLGMNIAMSATSSKSAGGTNAAVRISDPVRYGPNPRAWAVGDKTFEQVEHERALRRRLINEGESPDKQGPSLPGTVYHSDEDDTEDSSSNGKVSGLPQTDEHWRLDVESGMYVRLNPSNGELEKSRDPFVALSLEE